MNGARCNDAPDGLVTVGACQHTATAVSCDETILLDRNVLFITNDVLRALYLH